MPPTIWQLQVASTFSAQIHIKTLLKKENRNYICPSPQIKNYNLYKSIFYVNKKAEQTHIIQLILYISVYYLSYLAQKSCPDFNPDFGIKITPIFIKIYQFLHFSKVSKRASNAVFTRNPGTLTNVCQTSDSQFHNISSIPDQHS